MQEKGTQSLKTHPSQLVTNGHILAPLDLLAGWKGTAEGRAELPSSRVGLRWHWEILTASLSQMMFSSTVLDLFLKLRNSF